MTARIVVAQGVTETVAEAVRWATTPVRVVESGTPGWVWVVPDAAAAALDRVVDEASSARGAAFLLTVGEWRAELQLWRSERRVVVLGWEPGAAAGLEHEDAVHAAQELSEVVPDVDPRAVARLLAGPRPGAGAWRDVVDLLRIPLPRDFPERSEGILPGVGERVSATGLLDAIGLVDDVRWMRSASRWMVWVLLALAATMSFGSALVARSVVYLAVGCASLAALGWWVLRHWSQRRASRPVPDRD